MSDNSFWVKIWGMIMATIMAITATVCIYLYKSDTDMAKLGYEQETIAGYSMPVWRKVK